MRSVLTRTVFQRLLTNEAYVFRCPHFARALSTRPANSSSPSRHTSSPRTSRWPAIARAQRRTLFGFSRKPPREARTQDLAPGLTTMVKLNALGSGEGTIPRRSDLLEAWSDFLSYKIKKKEPVNSLQAAHVLRTFRYLRDHQISTTTLTMARKAMWLLPLNEANKGALENHAEFARALVEKLTQISANEDLKSGKKEMSETNFKYLTTVLIASGHLSEATEMSLRFVERGLQTQKLSTVSAQKIWSRVLKGLAAMGAEQMALEDIIAVIDKQGIHIDPWIHQAMTTFYASKNDLVNTRRWFETRIPKLEKGEADYEVESSPLNPTADTLSAVLEFCSRNGHTEWAKKVFKEALNSNPSKDTWDVLFVWTAGPLGKGVEDVERMLTAMVKYNADRPGVVPDIQTFNGLLRLAMSKNDPYLAERFLALALKFECQPNAQTYLLQMDYRIDAGDLRGVQAAYSLLQAQEVLDDQDVPVINRYIRALCMASTPNHTLIDSLASELDERNIRLEATTTSALCMSHLARDEHENVLDLLNTHAFHYTTLERALIRDQFLEFCFDRSNSTAQAWDAYTIMRNFFDETDVPTRVKLMDEFFQRGRSDMGTHAFGHLRQHERREMRPTAKEYVACFEGIASAADMESLSLVHNMMKLDISVEPSTTLYNSLMLAYTSCSQPYRALDFWVDITNSSEGPNYRSLEIVFWVCQKKPFGDRSAREIWARMRNMEIEITPTVFSAYVDSLAGQALIDECIELIESAEKDHGIAPNALLLASFHNAAPGQNRKDPIAAWAKKTYPDLWEQVEGFGLAELDDEWVGRLYKIERNNRA